MCNIWIISLAALISPYLVQSCGYIPSSCYSDLSWAVSTGKTDHTEYYPNFQSVTGTALSSASQDDMVLYWVCTGENPNDNCGGLEMPCSRSCYPSTDTSGTSQSLSVVTMNLYWWNLFGQRGGENFFSVFSASGPYDILFFQECDNVDYIKNGLGYDLSTYGPAHSVALAWSNSRFTVVSQGWEDVAEDRSDQYYGTRCVVWARLRDSVTGAVVFAVSHHGPLPVDTGGKTGGETVARRINEVISWYKESGDAVIIGGDFNAQNWFTTITALQNTYGYNQRASDWVDHIFTAGSALSATPQVVVVTNTGSDHNGLKVTWTGGLDANQAFEAEDVDGDEYTATDAASNEALFWSLIALGAIGAILCAVITGCVWRRKKKKATVSVKEDSVELRDDEQLQGVDDQMIELEEGTEIQPDAEDGDETVIEVTAQ